MNELITNISGVTFYQENVNRFACEDIGSYRLEREHYNKFDAFAIAVTVGSYKLGYIPKSINKELAEDMDKGKYYTALFHKRMDGWEGHVGFSIKISELGRN